MIGSILITPSTIDEAVQIVRPEHIRVAMNRQAYETALSLVEAGTLPDIVTMTHGMVKRGADPAEAGLYLAELTRTTPTSANTAGYARLVFESWLRTEGRRIGVRLADEIAQAESDPFEATRKAESALHTMIDRSSAGGAVSIGTALTESIQHIVAAKERRKKGKFIDGIPSGLFAVDDRFDGWQPGHLYVLAGRPGTGKTALGMQFAHYAARRGHPVHINSMEMTQRELLFRMISTATRISTSKLRRGEIKDHELDFVEAERQKIDELPITIDATSHLDVRDVWSRARLAVRRDGVKFLLVDFLQLLRATGHDNRAQEVDMIAKTLKNVARDLSISVMVLCQLNREVERRSKRRRPQLADLKESSGIEEAADGVMFLYRPEMYDDDPNKVDDRGIPRPEGYTELITDKYRHGATGVDEIRWRPYRFAFEDVPDSQIRLATDPEAF